MVDDGPRLYYKLTNEPKGLGELNITATVMLFRIYTYLEFSSLFLFLQVSLPTEVPRL